MYLRAQMGCRTAKLKTNANSERNVRMWSAEGAHKGCTHCLKTTEKWEIE